jgi:ribosome modulation factor
MSNPNAKSIPKREPLTRHQLLVYGDGKEARINGQPKGSCPKMSDDPMYCCWLMGWHDADLEAGVRTTNFHPITKQELAA